MLRMARFRWFLAAVLTAAIAAIPAHPQANAQQSRSSPSPAPPFSGPALAQDLAQYQIQPVFKPDAKKAREAFKRGTQAEQSKDWKSAFEDYSDAVNFAPADREYLLHREIARSQIVQGKMDDAERLAVSGHLVEALKELRSARDLDPTNAILRERLTELTAQLPRHFEETQPAPQLSSEIQLQYVSGKRSFDFHGDSQAAYEEAARAFGVEVAFDVDLHPRPVNVHVENLDFPHTMALLDTISGTFWRPLTSHLFYVSEDTPQKRKDYEASVVRTVLLSASESPEEMTETVRLVREVAGVTRSSLDNRTRTLTMRASPSAIALASDLIDEIEKPAGELVLEIEILEVDRNYARELGITPPSTAKVYTLPGQQLEQAIQSQSLSALIGVITQVFGQPSSLSGLSASQISSLVSAGQVGLGTLLPPLIAFGGGQSTFIGTLPGAAANFSEMLSLVRQGRRILLRAEDGQSATFFVGDRFPISLTQFSPSLGGPASSVPGVSSTNFPITDLDAGQEPQFVTAADLRNKQIQDLMVANFKDSTISVFLGNGDGTFVPQVTYATGTGPVGIATGVFNNASTNISLAVANQQANTVSVLLGNGDGTFQAKTDLPTGNGPDAVVAANLHDLNGKNNLDLVVANFADNTLSIFQGNGDGTFLAPTTLPTGHGPSFVATGDFNNDGHFDLAVTNKTDNTVSIFLGKGDGTFQNRVDYVTGNAPEWVSVADFNGDTIPDLAVANNSDNSVSILLGQSNTGSTTGNGTFSAKSDFAVGNGPTSISVADYNIDGRPDLAVTDQTDNAVSLLLGAGDGTFGPNLELNVGNDPVASVSADFNADGRPDLAIANFGSNTASVILNSSNFSTVNGISGQPYPGVQYIDIGVKVKATPRIHLNSDVTLKLNFDLTSLTSTSFNGIPVIANQQLEQTVRVHDDQTAVLAGFLAPQSSRTLGGTPGLATIPGAGLLAGSENVTNANTELLILITPHLASVTPRKDRVIYAGRGSLQGPGAFGPTIEERQAAPEEVTPVVPPANPSEPVRTPNP